MYIYIHKEYTKGIYIFLFRFFSILDYYKILNIAPCAIRPTVGPCLPFYIHLILKALKSEFETVCNLFVFFCSVYVFIFLMSTINENLGTTWRGKK